MNAVLRALVLLMATGTVELTTQIGTAGSYTGDPAYVKAKAVDGDFTTLWVPPSGAGDWIGVDAGVACTLVEVRFAPRRGTSNADRFIEREIVGAKVQASSSATFASDVTDCDTIPSSPYYPSLQMNRRTIAGAPSKRYLRWTHATNYPQLAEVRFIVNAGPTAAKPVAPTASPMGGRYPTGSVTVTLASGTTSAAIYRTIDGSTPTSASTLYTGPFTLTIDPAGTTLKFIAIDNTLGTTDSDVVSALFVPWGYKPREDWKDDRGVLIEAHCGGFLKNPGGTPKLVSGKYWFYGTLANAYNGSGVDANAEYGICAYSTTDFYNFTFEGQIIDPPGGYGVRLCARPHPIYHSGTAKYVIWAFVTGPERALIATADSPDGPWTVQTSSLDPDGVGFKDCHVYHASDGRAFVAYVPSSQDRILISELDVTNGYLTTTGATPVVAVSGAREAPVLGESADGSYFLHNSAQNYYDDSLTYNQKVATATNPLGTWGSNVAAFASDPLGTNYNGQSTDALRFNSGVLVLLDAWQYVPQYDSRYVWLPYRSGVIETPASWDLVTYGYVQPPVGSISGARL